MIYVFLANGFEEVEALTPVDILRRVEKKVVTVGVGSEIIRGSHGIPVVTDTIDSEIVLNDELEMIILPGGMPGTLNLGNSEFVIKAIDYCVKNNIYIGAICAAPSVLGQRGLLKGRKATCYYGFENQLFDADVIIDKPVVCDGNIITSRGCGTAFEFAFTLAQVLTSESRIKALKEAVIWNNQ